MHFILFSIFDDLNKAFQPRKTVVSQKPLFQALIFLEKINNI
jgi:hypothetical protein